MFLIINLFHSSLAAYPFSSAGFSRDVSGCEGGTCRVSAARGINESRSPGFKGAIIGPFSAIFITWETRTNSRPRLFQGGSGNNSACLVLIRSWMCGGSLKSFRKPKEKAMISDSRISCWLKSLVRGTCVECNLPCL